MAKPRYAYDSRLRPIAVTVIRSNPQEKRSWSISIAIKNKFGRTCFGRVFERFPNSGHVGTAYFATEAEARTVIKELGLDRFPEEA